MPQSSPARVTAGATAAPPTARSRPHSSGLAAARRDSAASRRNVPFVNRRRTAALVMALGLLALATAVPLARAATTWPASPTCFWGRPNDPNVVNGAYPDKAATYWAGRPFLPPGSQLELHGRYAHARYMSFNAYNAQLQPVDGLADVKIAPDPGSTNPFVAGADRTAPNRNYTLAIVQGPAPADRAPNTLYMDAPVILYRVYVPDAGSDITGDAGLPTVTLRQADGT